MSEINLKDASEYTIASPCVRHCCLNEDDICLGCFRSLSEVVAWGSADNAMRENILANAHERRKNKNAQSGKV
jgi:predicted Fe-S protein YdhL (DUF1289 family)